MPLTLYKILQNMNSKTGQFDHRLLSVVRAQPRDVLPKYNNVAKQKYDCKNISVVSIVPCKCGMFKYVELIILDANLKYSKSQHNFQDIGLSIAPAVDFIMYEKTESQLICFNKDLPPQFPDIATESVGDMKYDTHTMDRLSALKDGMLYNPMVDYNKTPRIPKTPPIEMRANNLGIVRQSVALSDVAKNTAHFKKCNEFALLLDSNTTLFELATIPSIDLSYPIDNNSYLDSLIITNQLSNKHQSKFAIDSMFLKYKSILTTLVVTNNAYIYVDSFRMSFDVKRCGWYIKFTSRSEDNCEIKYVLNHCDEFKTIKDVLITFNYKYHKYYIVIGSYICDYENATEMYGAVIKNKTLSEWLNPTELNIEMIRHIDECNIELSKSLLDVIYTCREYINNWRHDAKKNIKASRDNNLGLAIYEYRSTIDSHRKYTILYSIQSVITNIHNQLFCKKGTPPVTNERTHLIGRKLLIGDEYIINNSPNSVAEVKQPVYMGLSSFV